jgi:hypothetical protein
MYISMSVLAAVFLSIWFAYVLMPELDRVAKEREWSRPEREAAKQRKKNKKLGIPEPSIRERNQKRLSVLETRMAFGDSDDARRASEEYDVLQEVSRHPLKTCSFDKQTKTWVRDDGKPLTPTEFVVITMHYMMTQEWRRDRRWRKEYRTQYKKFDKTYRHDGLRWVRNDGQPLTPTEYQELSPYYMQASGASESPRAKRQGTSDECEWRRTLLAGAFERGDADTAEQLWDEAAQEDPALWQIDSIVHDLERSVAQVEDEDRRKRLNGVLTRLKAYRTPQKNL